MKRSLLVLFLGVSLLGLAVCGPAWVPPPVSPELVKRGQARFPDVTAEQLGRGREILVTRCTRCHRLPFPNAYSESKWPRIVDRMGRKARLDAADKQILLRFMLANR